MITVCEYVFSRECKGGVCVDIHARVEAREHLIPQCHTPWLLRQGLSLARVC